MARTSGSSQSSPARSARVGAIVLDRAHHVVRAATTQGGVVAGVQRVEGHDAPGEVEPGEQGTNGRDLVALVLYRLLSEDDSGAVLGGGDEQVLGARVVPGGATDVLPVDGDGGRCARPAVRPRCAPRGRARRGPSG